MNLLYKPDCEEAQARYRAWWAHEYFGCCALPVVGRREDSPPGEEPARPADIETYRTDLNYWVRRRRFWFARTFYGGEAFPQWHCGYPGRESLASFLGSPVTLGPDTAWR